MKNLIFYNFLLAVILENLYIQGLKKPNVQILFNEASDYIKVHNLNNSCSFVTNYLIHFRSLFYQA